MPTDRGTGTHTSPSASGAAGSRRSKDTSTADRATGEPLALPSASSRNSVPAAVRGGRSGPLTGAHHPIAVTTDEITGSGMIEGSVGPDAGTAVAAVQVRARWPTQSRSAAMRQLVG
ncbi:MAG: hypothetical protein WCK58_00040 [Chloroflexota bacterium]